MSPAEDPPLLLQGVTLPDGTLADVSLAGGRVAGIGDAGSLPAEGTSAFDLNGFVLMPSLVEPHAHLDKAFTADAVINPDGSLLGAIDAWLPARVGFQRGDIAARAWAVTRRYLLNGTSAIRAHVDTGEGIDLRAIEAILAVREAFGDLIDIQIVAGCSRPVTGVAGATNRAMLADALDAGADLVGGAPAIDAEPFGAIDLLVEAAVKAGVGMDLHIDETLDPSMHTIDHLVEVADAGFGATLTASHVVSLGVQPAARQESTARALAEAGIGVVTLPQTNLFLQGRGEGSLARRGLTAVRTLLDEGVVVAAGGDNLQDPFNPMGRADPLETASLLVVAGHLLPPEAFAAVTSSGRKLLGLPAVGVALGAPADLVAVRAQTVRETIAGANPERVVFRAGRVVFRTQLTTDTALPAPPDWNERW